jgi:peptidoglycan/xylan/chitin deacetylase (PgdA/CDA1 family)
MTSSIPILMYHSIAERAAPRFRQFVVPPAEFADQMAVLCDEGYSALTTTQLVDHLVMGEPLPPKPVVVTFDDGFADFSSAAMPILDRYGVTATLYVATDYLDGTSRWLAHEGEADRPMLSWAELADVAAAGIEIGGHTASHPRLDRLAPRAAAVDIRRGKRAIEDQLGRPCNSFAYPYGAWIDSVRRSVIKLGFTSACAVTYQFSSPASDRFTLARLIVRPGLSAAGFSALLRSSRLSRVLAIDYLRCLAALQVRRAIPRRWRPAFV